MILIVYTLQNLLNDYTKNELIHIYKNQLSLDIKTSAVKADLIKSIETELLDSCEEIISAFPSKLIKFLSKAVNAKDKQAFRSDYEKEARYLIKIGFAFTEYANGSSYIIMADEVKNKLKPVINNYILHSENEIDKITAILYGLVNLFGVVELEYVFSVLNEGMNYDFDYYTYYEVIDCLTDYEGYIHFDGDYLYHAKVDNIFNILDNRTEDELTYYEYTAEEIEKYGEKETYYDTSAVESFRDYLLSLKKVNRDDMNKLLYELTVAIQLIRDAFYQLSVINRYVSITSFESMSMVIRYLEEINHTLPKWINFGYSDDDLKQTGLTEV